MSIRFCFLRRLGVALSVLILAACGNSDDAATVAKAPADLAITGANGYTMADGALSQFDTMVITKGRIVAIGDADLLEGYAAERVVDVAGETILPGLIDAHGHVSSLGQLRANLDLAGIDSLDATLSRISAYVREQPDSTAWVLGRGWNQVLWTENRFPTAADLDSIVADRPVFLNRIDGHAAWANTAALELAGITRDTANPVGGEIVRDANGDATGVLIDTAMPLVARVILPPSRDDQRNFLKNAMYELASLGVTGVHDAGTTALEVALYKELADADEMPIRVSAMLAGTPTLAEFDGPIRGYARDLFEVTSVKLYADGALGSRGAAMIKEYSDDSGNLGLMRGDTAKFTAQIKAAHAKGLAANVHAIGDRANRIVLDAFAAASDGKPSGFNDRIEHAQIVALEDIPRFAELNIVASMQPTHATSDKNMAEDRVGPERILGGYAWRRMLDAGVRVAAGSDFPVEKPEMFDGLYAAVSRMGKDGEPVGGWYPDQALTREETLAAFTIWAADSVGQADRIGSLEPGKWADFIVIDRDYFEIPVEEIWQIAVLQTWVGGREIAAVK
ncbi:MAG: amidohydrolase family protein [Pseudomonadota bacterium]